MMKSVKIRAIGISFLALLGLGGLFILLPTPTSEIDLARVNHRKFVNQSPVKSQMALSKSERKRRSLPPNSYNERMWELTMNPRLGYPTPYKVEPIPSDITAKSVPGSSLRPWEERGPNNIAGRTRVVFYDPNDVGIDNGDGIDYNRVFAGGVGGGLWVNDNINDPNSSWNIISGVAANLSVQTYAIDPIDSNIMYIGTGEQYTGGAAIGNGLYRSVDGGDTWAQVPIPPAGIGTATSGTTDLFKAGVFFINDVLVRNNNGNREIYVAVGSSIYGAPNFNISNPRNSLGAQTSGLYRSTDDGATWSRIESTNMAYSFGGVVFYFTPNDLELGADNVLYMGTVSSLATGQGGGRIYSSVDGVVWTLESNIAGANRMEIAASRQDANRFYVAADVSNEGDLFATSDAFTTVTPINEPNDADNSIPPTDFARGQAFYNLVIEVDPLDDQIIYVGGIDLFRSTNGGNNYGQISKWMNGNGLQTINAPYIHADIHAVTLNPIDPNRALIGSDGGVSLANSLSTATFNPGAIETRNNNFNITQFYYGAIAQTPAPAGLLGGAQDNGSLFAGNAAPGINSFTPVLGGDGGYVGIDETDGYAVLSTQFNNHRRYTYPSFNFEYCITANCSDGGNNAEGDFINVAVLDPEQDYLFSNSKSFTDDNVIEACQLFAGVSACNNLSNNLIDNNRPTAFEVSPFTTTSTTLMVGTEFSDLIKIDNANTNNPTWTSISSPNFLGSVSDIEFGNSQQEIYLTMHNYGVDNIWYTADGGNTWVSKDGNLPDIPVKTILANPLLNGEVIIGTELGIYATSNFNLASPVWQPLINGMTNVKVVDLDLRTADNTILATTHGRGQFTGQFDTLGIADSDFSEQNIRVFPTVSQGRFKIASTTGLEKARVNIFNLSGQEIFQSVVDLTPTGTAVEIDATPGMYLVNIQKGRLQLTQKIIIR